MSFRLIKYLLKKKAGFKEKKKEKKMVRSSAQTLLPKLPMDFSPTEVFIYFAIYILYMAYGFYAIANARSTILETAPADQFAKGWWPLAQVQRDKSNIELEIFSKFIVNWWPWYALHAVVTIIAKIFQMRKYKMQHICQAIVCALALVYMLTALTIICLAMLLASFYVIALYNNKKLIWLLAATWMLILQMIKNSNYFFIELGFIEFFICILLMSWSVLRCCSYALNYIADNNMHKSDEKDMSIYSLSNYLGYTLYFPTIIYGPLMGYRRYAVIFDKERTNMNMQTYNSSRILIHQIIEFFINLLRTLIWWFVMNFLLHYLYVHYMAYDVQAVLAVGNAFEQHVVGYFMGQMFFLFYVVTYGLGIAFARFDGLEPPHKPRCIGRIHFYSNMWKYFDEGLYEFLFTHIYKELRGHHHSVVAKLSATAATFAFVFVWHGCYSYILLWSILNFLCLVAEKLFISFIKSPIYQQCIEENLCPIWAQKIRAIMASQLFIPAAFSNIYFISGQAVGNLLMSGAYLSGIFNYIILTICSYCFFQCSEIITAYLDKCNMRKTKAISQ